jgi:hypothetical protein
MGCFAVPSPFAATGGINRTFPLQGFYGSVLLKFGKLSDIDQFFQRLDPVFIEAGGL